VSKSDALAFDGRMGGPARLLLEDPESGRALAVFCNGLALFSGDGQPSRGVHWETLMMLFASETMAFDVILHDSEGENAYGKR